MAEDVKQEEVTTSARTVEVDDDLVDELVDRVAARLRPASGSSSRARADEHAGLAEQIRKAVEEATASEKAKSSEQKHRETVEQRLKDLEARREMKPKQYSALTKFFWGGGDDD